MSFQSCYSHPAYDATAEISQYRAEVFRGQGRGKARVAHGPAQAPGLGIRTLLGYFFTGNEPSFRLFRACGLAELAHLPNIARLDGIARRLKVQGCGKARARLNRNGSFWPNCPPTVRLIATEKAAGSTRHHHAVPLRHRTAASATSGPTCNPLT